MAFKFEDLYAIRDVMPRSAQLTADSAADAQHLLQQYGADAWIMAGGLDSFDWLKDRIKRPKVLVDLSGIAELRGIRTTTSGIEIGALTTLTEIVKHAVIKEQYGLLAEAAELIASPQIRNQGTIGGNVSQDTRCWYFPRRLAVLPRWRKPSAMPTRPPARNREHAILYAGQCCGSEPSSIRLRR